VQLGQFARTGQLVSPAGLRLRATVTHPAAEVYSNPECRMSKWNIAWW
jgi:hypothetical protein